MRWLLTLLAVFAICGSPAYADQWLPPTVVTTYSAGGGFRFVVESREIRSPLAYFEAKASSGKLPGASPPQGRLERQIGTRWEVVWKVELVNEVAPVFALVSDDGKRVVTFDNWHSLGFGDNVVVIYGVNGNLINSLRLDQLIPAYFVDGLPRSVSSLNWHGAEPVLHGSMLKLPIADVDRDAKESLFSVSVSLVDGSVEPISPVVLNAIRPRFCAAHVRVVAASNAFLAYKRSDLVRPASGEKDQWDRYQNEVVSRLRTIKEGEDLEMVDSPRELLLPGEYMQGDFRRTFREALSDRSDDEPVRWFSSRNLELMVGEVQRAARKIKTNQLAGVELHFLTDSAHWPLIQTALAQSGAKLVLVDITKPIPQTHEALTQLPVDLPVDPACK